METLNYMVQKKAAYKIADELFQSFMAGLKKNGGKVVGEPGNLIGYSYVDEKGNENIWTF